VSARNTKAAILLDVFTERTAVEGQERQVDMIIVLSLLVALVGVLMYALSGNPKLVEIGRLAFFAGLLAFLLLGSGPAINLLHR
jgi:hypothetical protein